jgi:germination protein M
MAVMKKNMIKIKVLSFFAILFFLISALPFLNACLPNTVEVTLYFAGYTETDFYLEPETRKITDDRDLYKKVLEELIGGPDSKELYPTLPSSTKVNSVAVENGLAIVDLSKEIITDTAEIPHSSTTETLAIFSIVNSLTEFEDIEKVKIIINGMDKGKIDGMQIEDFWGHVGIYEEFIRNKDIINKPD